MSGKAIFQANLGCELNINCFNYPECKQLKKCISKQPKNSIFNLTGLTRIKQAKLYTSGVKTFEDAREAGVELTPHAQRQLDFEIDDLPMYIDKQAILSIIAKYTYPLTFFAFTMGGDRVKRRRVLKDYTLRIKPNCSAKNCEERYFSPKTLPVCERDAVLALVRDMPSAGTILVYSGVGDGVCELIDNLLLSYPDLEPKLTSIRERIADLREIFEKGYLYARKMQGSFNLGHVYIALRQGEADARFKEQVTKSDTDALTLNLVLDLVSELVSSK